MKVMKDCDEAVLDSLIGILITVPGLVTALITIRGVLTIR